MPGPQVSDLAAPTPGRAQAIEQVRAGISGRLPAEQHRKSQGQQSLPVQSAGGQVQLLDDPPEQFGSAADPVRQAMFDQAQLAQQAQPVLGGTSQQEALKFLGHALAADILQGRRRHPGTG